ncbi:MAG TPA: serine hydrolase domain-containing protein [Lysobacter sp.]
MTRIPLNRRIALALWLQSVAFAACAQDACLDRAVAAIDIKAVSGQMVVSTLAPDGRRDTRVLAGQDAGTRLDGSEGFRIASITKTYVAATALRLVEEGKLDLKAPITRYLPAAWTDLLAKDGYKPQQITVRHLLSHTSGLNDHAQAPQFIATIKTDSTTQWTRAIDVERLVQWTDPVGTPGEKYAYSDTGYVLLGAIIEHVSGQDLAKAVRKNLGLDRLGLPGTYWERLEPARGRERAHQFFEGIDTYDWDPSMDLFGGGGLVATPQDLTVFFDALLEGRVFKKKDTLALMESPAGLPAGSPYRLGLLMYDFHGIPAVGHSGFWGTLVVREPGSGYTIAGAVTHREAFAQLKDLVDRYVQTVSKPGPTGTSPACAGDADANSPGAGTPPARG